MSELCGASGDVIDLELPMAITTETINDYRPWFQNLKVLFTVL